MTRNISKGQGWKFEGLLEAAIPQQQDPKSSSDTGEKDQSPHSLVVWQFYCQIFQKLITSWSRRSKNAIKERSIVWLSRGHLKTPMVCVNIIGRKVLVMGCGGKYLPLSLPWWGHKCPRKKKPCVISWVSFLSFLFAFFPLCHM